MANAFQSNAFQETAGLDAFQVTVAAGFTVNAGSSISGGYFSKGKWHKFKKEYEAERAAKAEAARKERQAERKEAALTPLQRAERDLAQCQAECDSLTEAFTQSPARHVYDRLNAALERLGHLHTQVAGLRREEAESKAKSEAAKAKALRNLQRQEAADALALRELQSKVSHALAAHGSTVRLANQLAHLRVNEAAFRVRQQMALEAARRAAQDDDEAALALLLLH